MSTGLLIFTNHVYPYHVGGSEIVVDKIAERLAERLKVIVCGGDVPFDTKYKNYYHKKISTNIDLLNFINSHSDYEILIYSDGYIFTKSIFTWSENRHKSIFIAPVGFNICRDKKDLMDIVVRNKNIHLIYHDSNYIDYEYGCKFLHENRKFTIIPNGYDSREFLSQAKDINKNFNIITIANTFPFKGHDLCINALDILKNSIDFKYHVFCSTPSWIVAKNRLSWLKKEADKRKDWFNLHIDCNREKMIKYLVNSDLMLFLSQKEVSPLVLLESCAAKIPWISLNVGNAKSIPGGFVIDTKMDHNGNRVMTNGDFDIAVDKILQVYNNKFDLNLDSISNFLSNREWSFISNQYYEFIFK